MIQDITVTVTAADKADESHIRQYAASTLGCPEQDITALIFKKKSLDARHGQVKFHLRYTVYTKPDAPDVVQADAIATMPQYLRADPAKRVIIIGCGPAGLFAALRLLEEGITPVVVERGSSTSERKRAIAEISTKHTINADSNYCFGEGGAGTFSDGKLYTRSIKRGNPAKIYRVFNYFGADQTVMTDAHPHIGTDKLPHIINGITEKIKELGGEILLDTKCTGFITTPLPCAELQPKTAKQRVTGITTRNTKTGQETSIEARAVILAAGHSAGDIYELLAGIAPDSLEAKTFAAGVRIEHPREHIDHIQYHGRERTEQLPAAEYRLKTQINGRGVYSFCMCPGGLVIPSATEDSGLVINGMSPSSRAARWSNAAIVVEIRPEDICNTKTTQPEADGNAALAGLRFRTELEQLAKKHGSGQAAPAQRLTDFLAGRQSVSLPQTSYTPGLIPSRLDLWLPEHISSRLKAAFAEFGYKMPGFITNEAVLIAPETRTSTPARILRDEHTSECTALAGLYPAGEGSGYSGGIVSSAIDGEKAAESIIRLFAAD